MSKLQQLKERALKAVDVRLEYDALAEDKIMWPWPVTPIWSKAKMIKSTGDLALDKTIIDCITLQHRDRDRDEDIKFNELQGVLSAIGAEVEYYVDKHGILMAELTG